MRCCIQYVLCENLEDILYTEGGKFPGGRLDGGIEYEIFAVTYYPKAKQHSLIPWSGGVYFF